MYTDPKILESIRKVEAARAENVKLNPARMTAEEKDGLAHRPSIPTTAKSQFTTLRSRPKQGRARCRIELASCFRGAQPRIDA